MFNMKRQPALVALLLVAFMVFGAVASEASDRHRSDRVVRDALIGAAIGTLSQIARGRDEGRQLVNGAIVGGAFGAAVGASRDGRRYGSGYRGHYGRNDYYYNQYNQPYSYGSYDSSPYYYDDGYRGYDRGYDGYGSSSSHRHHRGCGRH